MNWLKPSKLPTIITNPDFAFINRIFSTVESVIDGWQAIESGNRSCVSFTVVDVRWL